MQYHIFSNRVEYRRYFEDNFTRCAHTAYVAKNCCLESPASCLVGTVRPRWLHHTAPQYRVGMHLFEGRHQQKVGLRCSSHPIAEACTGMFNEPGSCYNVLLITCSKVDVVPEARIKPYDCCPQCSSMCMAAVFLATTAETWWPRFLYPPLTNPYTIKGGRLARVEPQQWLESGPHQRYPGMFKPLKYCTKS